MLESLLEPVKAYEYHKGIDEDWVRNAGDKVHGDLLVGLHVVDVDCVQTGLRGTTGGEEDRVDIGYEASTEQDY